MAETLYSCTYSCCFEKEEITQGIKNKKALAEHLMFGKGFFYKNVPGPRMSYI